MKKFRNLFLCLAVTITACPVWAQPINILATGDMHGWINAQDAGRDKLGGAAEMLAYWKSVEGYKPDKFLVLSCGDNETGPAVSTVFKGEPVIEVMNKMGYDASVLGNHEFDFGVDEILKWERTAKFPFLAANLVENNGNPIQFAYPYTIINQGGVKVGIIGLTVNDLFTETNNAKGLNLLDDAAVLRKIVPEVRNKGAQSIIILTHETQDNNIQLAKAVADLQIPLILGGHSHEFAQRQVDNTWVVNNGQWWDSYTRINLDYNTKTNKTVVLSSKQVWLEQQNPKTDPAVAAVVKKWDDRMNKEYGVTVAYTQTGLNSSLLYKLVPDTWLGYDKDADAAVNNIGSLRQDILPGKISKATLVGVMPFIDKLVKVTITGEQLMKAAKGNTYAGLYTVGTSFMLSKTGQVIDPKGKYKVITTDYLQSVDSNLQTDSEITVVTESWRDPVLQWLQNHPTDKTKPVEKLIEILPKVGNIPAVP